MIHYLSMARVSWLASEVHGSADHDLLFDECYACFGM